MSIGSITPPQRGYIAKLVSRDTVVAGSSNNYTFSQWENISSILESNTDFIKVNISITNTTNTVQGSGFVILPVLTTRTSTTVRVPIYLNTKEIGVVSFACSAGSGSTFNMSLNGFKNTDTLTLSYNYTIKVIIEEYAS